MNTLIRTEDQDTRALADLLRLYERMGKIQLYTKISHETYTKSWSAKARNKAQGLQPGFPDFVVVLPDRVIFLELKRSKGGVVSKEQHAWIVALEGKFTVSIVVRGYEEAKEFLDMHLGSCP